MSLPVIDSAPVARANARSARSADVEAARGGGSRAFMDASCSKSSGSKSAEARRQAILGVYRSRCAAAPL